MKTIQYLHRHGEIELECELDYDGPQAATEIDPAWPAVAILVHARTGGVDITPLLSDSLVEQIEEGAVWAQC